MSLFCHIEEEGDVWDIDAFSNVVQRNECFLASLDLTKPSMYKSPAMEYLDRSSYVTEDASIEGIHPYAFSSKVQTHGFDNLT